MVFGSSKRRRKRRQWEMFADEGHLPPEANEFLGEAIREFNEKTDALDTIWHFNELRRWGFDVDAGRFTLELQGGAEVGADGNIVGSYRPADYSWEWAWFNPNARPEDRQATIAVKDFGEKLGIPFLTDGTVSIPDGEWATYLSAMAVKVLGSDGAHFGETGGAAYAIALKNLTWLRK